MRQVRTKPLSRTGLVRSTRPVGSLGNGWWVVPDRRALLLGTAGWEWPYPGLRIGGDLKKKQYNRGWWRVRRTYW